MSESKPPQPAAKGQPHSRHAPPAAEGQQLLFSSLHSYSPIAHHPLLLEQEPQVIRNPRTSYRRGSTPNSLLTAKSPAPAWLRPELHSASSGELSFATLPLSPRSRPHFSQAWPGRVLALRLAIASARVHSCEGDAAHCTVYFGGWALDVADF